MGSIPLPSFGTSRQRVFPATVTPGEQATVTKLSIVDATVARFSSCAAVWLYNATETSQDITLHHDRLRQTLRETLDDYRHFTGQLRWATEDDIKPGDLNRRHVGRPLVSYGTPADPGVELVFASYGQRLGDVVPSAHDRRTTKKAWIATGFPQDELLPKCKLAFNLSLAEFDGLPGVAVQVTRFSCGGWAVGVMMSHCLADAVCLLRFVHSWAARTQALIKGGEGATLHSRIPKPVFEPGLLDQHAGLTDSLQPDAKLVTLARSLPMHRYDWWATDAPGYPAWATASSNATKPNNQAEIKLSPSTFPPWPTWDLSAPVDHVQIRFGADKVARMKQAAQAALPDEQQHQSISRLDALLAHMWILINRARQHQDTQEQVYLDITLGLRTRVSPPLPDTFAGSPILLGHVSQRGSDACSAAGLGAAALSVRRMM
ncbi:hypothetical protein N8I77_008891 [Diaporthe amygdali]|uniref:Uncharacterized protein n=1 Tax=Phomopsis amygdali TaxID=1214568 RepID=A0AAD9W2N3_PHOAM|nr:hypothetical protein N8I77_008891 [Diaporthe amygdali]